MNYISEEFFNKIIEELEHDDWNYECDGREHLYIYTEFGTIRFESIIVLSDGYLSEYLDITAYDELDNTPYTLDPDQRDNLEDYIKYSLEQTREARESRENRWLL